MEFEILETERLLLRKLTPEVYDYIYSNYSDEKCIELLGLNSQEELQVEKDKYHKGLSAYDRTFVIFQLIEKSSQQILGMSGFVRYYPEHFRAELGYALNHNSFKQKGYMYEACAAIIDYGFTNMGIVRIEALVGPENVASLKLVNKLNFKKEGHLKKHFYKNGVFYDSILFSRFKEE